MSSGLNRASLAEETWWEIIRWWGTRDRRSHGAIHAVFVIRWGLRCSFEAVRNTTEFIDHNICVGANRVRQMRGPHVQNQMAPAMRTWGACVRWMRTRSIFVYVLREISAWLHVGVGRARRTPCGVYLVFVYDFTIKPHTWASTLHTDRHIRSTRGIISSFIQCLCAVRIEVCMMRVCVMCVFCTWCVTLRCLPYKEIIN